jgi:hypothetical protein
MHSHVYYHECKMNLCFFCLFSLEITTILKLNRVYDSVWSFGKKRILLKYVKLIDKPHQHY